MRGRRFGTPLLALGLLVGLGGCVGLQSTSTNQTASMGSVRLTSAICASGSPSCNPQTNTPSIYAFLNEFDSDEKLSAQLLYAVRLPAGPTPSSSLTAAINGGGTLGFSRSPSYESELQALEPAPAGEKWWGWISTTFEYSRNSKQGLSVGVDVDLPRPADGGPLPSPLRWRPVVGARFVGNTTPASRPVQCGASNATLYDRLDETGQPNATAPTIVCVDSPSPDATRGFLEAPIIDFGLLGTKNAVTAGGTVGVVFQAKRTGLPDPSTTFDLSLEGAPAGALVSLDKGSVALGGDAAQLVIATVVVPAGTPAGDYPLTLTAKAPGKPVRAAVSTLTVQAIPVITPVPTPANGGPNGGPNGGGPGPDITAPVISALSLSKKAIKRKKGTSSLNLTVSEAAKITVTVSRVTKGRMGRKVGASCSAKAKKGSRCDVVKVLKTVTKDAAAGKSAIVLPVKTLAKGSYRVGASAVDAAGNKSAAQAALTLKVS